MSRRSAQLALFALSIIGWVACSGDSSNPAGDPTTIPLTEKTASFDRLQAQLLTPVCTTCHAGSSAEAGLVLTADVAYQNLVGALPTNHNAVADGLRRVVPGNPDSSLLYRKLVFPPGFNVHDYGNPMPVGTAGVSVGQLEFVRQWIAAGAPKTGVVADAMLLADRELQKIPPFTPLAPPPPGTGIQLKINQFGVASNFERELFIYKELPNTSDIYVSRIEISMRPFSHHFALWMLANDTPAAAVPAQDSVRDLYAPDGSWDDANMAIMGYHVFFGASQTPQSNYVFPEGMALKVPAHMGIDLDAHYANYTGNVVPGEAYVNLYTIPAAQVKHALSTLCLSVYDFSLPANQVTVIAKTFLGSAPMTVTALTSHMHARGTKFQIQIVGGPRDGELIYENTDWQHPKVVTYATPIVLQKGQGLRSIVTYNNTTSKTINFGMMSVDEMSMIMGYYY